MRMLKDEHAIAIASFIGAHWSKFVDHCEEHGLAEEDADEAYKSVGGNSEDIWD